MKIVSDFYSDKLMASTFFQVQKIVYPQLDLELANNLGLLQGKVFPFAVTDDKGQFLSILNVTFMKLFSRGKHYKALQIGTVATLPDFQKNGFARMLQTHVLKKFEKTVDFTFLFANPNVMNFYPKFGFRALPQVVYKYYSLKSEKQNFTHLALDHDGLNLLKSLLTNRLQISNILYSLDSEWLTEFYCRTFFANDLWIDDKQETILVASVEGSTLHLHDIITTSLSKDFFKTFRWKGISEIQLGFTPDQFEGDFVKTTLPEDEQIFVMGNFPKDLTDFKFPTLAYT